MKSLYKGLKNSVTQSDISKNDIGAWGLYAALVFRLGNAEILKNFELGAGAFM